jgi:hypothetical protein
MPWLETAPADRLAIPIMMEPRPLPWLLRLILLGVNILHHVESSDCVSPFRIVSLLNLESLSIILLVYSII